MKSNLLNKKLKAYSALAGSLIAATGMVNGQVIYTDVDPDKYISGEDYYIDTYDLDLNNDGIVDYVFGSKNMIYDNYCIESNSIYVNPNIANAMASSNWGVKVLEPGDVIDGGMSWAYGNMLLAYHYDKVVCWGGGGSTWTFSTGNWLNTYEKFIGLKFRINNVAHYGWVRLSTGYYGIDVLDYAYEASPETAIMAVPCKDLIVYADTDGDKYGDVSLPLPVSDCIVPAGYALVNTDCNDADAGVHPDVAEIVNGIDDNCNGIVDDVPCITPSGLVSETISESDVALSWTADEGVVKYKVRYKKAGDDDWNTVKSKDNHITIGLLTDNTKYVWQVRSFCGNEPYARSDWSEKESFITASLKIIAESESPTVGVYPNPVSSSAAISLSIPEATHVSIELYDVAGKKLQTILDGNLAAGNQEVTFHRGQLSSGVYLLQVKVGNDVTVKKLVLE